MFGSEYEFRNCKGNIFWKINRIDPSMTTNGLEWEPPRSTTTNHLKDVVFSKFVTFLNYSQFERVPNSSYGLLNLSKDTYLVPFYVCRLIRVAKILRFPHLTLQLPLLLQRWKKGRNTETNNIVNRTAFIFERFNLKIS